MRTPYAPSTVRNILCVFPRYTPSFGTFHHAYPLLGGVRAFMPPQGLLLLAAYLPASWPVRFVDENIQAATTEDFHWADAVLVSGMHVQRSCIDDIVRRAHACGKPVALGGPSASGCPELYPEVDVVHVGELGDATDRLIALLDDLAGRPAHRLVLTTEARLPLTAFPMPAYELIALPEYFLASVQFSSGCPYTCEFCDIPALYGRHPRLKTPAQVLAELDRLREGGAQSVYFVDDNFIANPKAALDLLPHLVAWQKRHRYPLRIACEATLNIAKHEVLLGLMREAGFVTVFAGIETPEAEALQAMSKSQNLRLPILEAIETLNRYGLEVVSGIILGLDTDTADTADRIIEFIHASRIPILTINVLYALPKTPLWTRLEAAGRLRHEAGRESNVDFLLPSDTVLGMWRRCIETAFDPEALYARYAHQQAHTFRHRLRYPVDPRRLAPHSIRRGLGIVARLFWRIGVRSDYRRAFWRMAGRLLGRGRVEQFVHSTVVSYHLIAFARECLAGRPEPSFYAPARAPRVPVLDAEYASPGAASFTLSTSLRASVPVARAHPGPG
jgi:hopanoid C-2 methylase